jgi:hypothetical protein
MTSDGDEATTGRRVPRLVWVVVLAAVVFGAIQLVPSRITNPPVRREPPWDSPQTRALAVAACYDCHSNQTRNFWYERVAPVSWWIKGHVDDGRRRLNFSEWDPAHSEGARAARTVTEGSMPPDYYTWLGRHPDAKLTDAQRKQLADGLIATLGVGTGEREGEHDRR